MGKPIADTRCIATNRQSCRGSCVMRMLLAAALYLSICQVSFARSLPQLADYCPPEPATGNLTFKSMDSTHSSCAPSARDVVGQAVFQCWQQFIIDVNGCQVTMRTTGDRVVGPGKLPCRMFGLSGNLTGEGVEAAMRADVDGPALLAYYSREPEAVAALRYNSSPQLVRGIWDFMLAFTGDQRFSDNSWIEREAGAEPQRRPQHTEEEAMALVLGEQSADVDAGPQLQGGEHDGDDNGDDDLRTDAAGARLRRQQRHRNRRLAAASGASSGSSQLGGSHGLGSSSRHGPMRVYRTSETRVVVKAPTGCKYRYTVNPSSHVFEAPDRPRAHVELRTIWMVVASLSVVLTVVGLGICTYLSHRHAEYVSSYWEYQAVKDQLGSELPHPTYVRLFGEPPKTAAAAAAAISAATAAVAASRARAPASATTPAAAPPRPPQLSPAVQQSSGAARCADPGEAAVVGAGEPDGISSRSTSSANGSELGETADAAIQASEAADNAAGTTAAGSTAAQPGAHTDTAVHSAMDAPAPIADAGGLN